VSDAVVAHPTAMIDSRRAKYRASREAEARLLLLIDGFSRTRSGPRTLEGRVKLAKLDFLLRYPRHLAAVLASRDKGSLAARVELIDQDSPLTSRMVRYRYGPWDPSHYAILGSLVGRRLIEVVPAAGTHALGYRTTERGAELVRRLLEDGAFEDIHGRIVLLRRHLDLAGETLKRILYELPEVADASWHEELI
jgi:hypothetical protein